MFLASLPLSGAHAWAHSSSASRPHAPQLGLPPTAVLGAPELLAPRDQPSLDPVPRDQGPSSWGGSLVHPPRTCLGVESLLPLALLGAKAGPGPSFMPVACICSVCCPSPGPSLLAHHQASLRHPHPSTCRGFGGREGTSPGRGPGAGGGTRTLASSHVCSASQSLVGSCPRPSLGGWAL